jgi:hypothetical protein
MARPVRKGLFRARRLISLLQRIRPRGASSGHDGDTHAPVLIKLPASDRAVFWNQASGASFDCQSIPSLPSRKPLLTVGALSATGRVLCRHRHSCDGEPFSAPQHRPGACGSVVAWNHAEPPHSPPRRAAIVRLPVVRHPHRQLSRAPQGRRHPREGRRKASDPIGPQATVS